MPPPATINGQFTGPAAADALARRFAPRFPAASGTPLAHATLTWSTLRTHAFSARALDEDWLIYDDRFMGESTPGQYSAASGNKYLPVRFQTPALGMLASMKSFGSGTDVFCLTLTTNPANGDGLYATYDRGAGQVRWGKSVSGVVTNYDARAWVPSGTFDFAFTLSGTGAIIWVRDTSTSPPGPWLAKSAVDFVANTPWDFRVPATLAAAVPTHNYFPGAGSITITRVAAGWPAPIACANPTWITHADGRPLLSADASKAYFAATLPYVTVNSTALDAIASAEGGIYEFDLTNFAVKLTARYVVNRGSALRCDYTGSIVYDDDAATWRIVMPASSDLATTASTLRLYSYQGDLLHGFHNLGSASSLSLGTSNTIYDPDLRKISGTWYLAYTQTDAATAWTTQRPNLATSPDLTTWTVLGPDNANGDLEGSRLIRFGGVWKACFAELPTTGSAVRFYSLALSSTGTVANPLANAISPSHWAAAPLPVNGVTRAVLLSFDEYAGQPGVAFTWGRLHVLVSDQTQPGHEFEPVAPAWVPGSRKGAY